MYLYDNMSLNSSYNENCFRRKFAEKIKTHILYSGNFFNCAVYEVIWRDKVQPDRLQMAL